MKLLGKHYEQLVTDHLESHHYTIIIRNYQARVGEIDIIALSPDNTICFIEVRYRSSEHFGGAIESITHVKQQRLIKTAQYFLTENSQWRDCATRFDFFATNGKKLLWIEHAFYT